MGRRVGQPTLVMVERAKREHITCPSCGQKAQLNNHGKFVLHWDWPWGHRTPSGDNCPGFKRPLVVA